MSPFPLRGATTSGETEERNTLYPSHRRYAAPAYFTNWNSGPNAVAIAVNPTIATPMKKKSASTRPPVTARPAIGPDAKAREMMVARPGPGDSARKNMPMANATADSSVMLAAHAPHHRRHREIGAFATGSEPVGGAQRIARIAVLPHLGLGIDTRNGEADTDDAADQRGDELCRRVTGLPLHLVRALLLRGKLGDVAQQPSAVFDDLGTAIGMDDGVVPGRHRLAGIRLGWIPARTDVGLGAREDQHRLRLGMSGEPLPVRVGTRKMAFDDERLALSPRHGRQMRGGEAVGIMADERGEGIRLHQRQYLRRIGHLELLGNEHESPLSAEDDSVGVPLSRFFRPTRPYSIVVALDAIGLPERPRNLILDLGAAEADVAQQPVVELAEMAALTGALEPSENSIEEARGKTAISLGPRGTHEVGARFVTRIVPIHLAFSSIRNIRLSQLPP